MPKLIVKQWSSFAFVAWSSVGAGEGGGAAAEEVKFGVRGVSNGWTDEEKQKTGEGNWGGSATEKCPGLCCDVAGGKGGVGAGGQQRSMWRS